MGIVDAMDFTITVRNTDPIHPVANAQGSPGDGSVSLSGRTLSVNDHFVQLCRAWADSQEFGHVEWTGSGEFVSRVSNLTRLR
jgi:hypothetical protein